MKTIRLKSTILERCAGAKIGLGAVQQQRAAALGMESAAWPIWGRRTLGRSRWTDKITRDTTKGLTMADFMRLLSTVVRPAPISGYNRPMPIREAWQSG